MRDAPIKGAMVTVIAQIFDAWSANTFSCAFRYRQVNIAPAKALAVWPLGKLCILFKVSSFLLKCDKISNLRFLDIIWSCSTSRCIQPISFFANLLECTIHIRFADLDEVRTKATNELLQYGDDESPVAPVNQERIMTSGTFTS